MLRLLRYLKPFYITLEGGKAAMDFAIFLKDTLPHVGLDWRRFRRKSIRRRVLSRMQELRITSFRQYTAMIEESPDEQARFRVLLSVTISRFFRDRELFQTLQDRVLPECVGRCLPRGRCMVWSAGCASGEEPYSLAILWRTYFRMIPVELRVCATDIDPHCLERARRAEYGPGSLKEVPPELQRSCFEPLGQKYRVQHDIQEMVELRAHDLMTDRIPGRFRLVLCRNMAFTYFSPTLHERIAQKLHASLEAEGFLVIGQKESLPAGSEDYFEQWDTSIYRRKGRGAITGVQ